MINLEDKTIILNNKTSSISKFEVWFRIPIGITEDLDVAITKCREFDWDPKFTIVPVVIAWSDDGNYEEFAYK